MYNNFQKNGNILRECIQRNKLKIYIREINKQSTYIKIGIASVKLIVRSNQRTLKTELQV